jgi:hypothetical protein
VLLLLLLLLLRAIVATNSPQICEAVRDGGQIVWANTKTEVIPVQTCVCIALLACCSASTCMPSWHVCVMQLVAIAGGHWSLHDSYTLVSVSRSNGVASYTT